MSRPLPPALLAGLLAACAGIAARPASSTFHSIAYQDLWLVVASTLDAEGYLVRHRDPDGGVMETDWAYGPSVREMRGPSRTKVVATLEPDGAGWRVAVRVREEVLRKGGMLATEPRDAEGWEAVPDDFERAETIVARIAATIQYGGS